jgi:hypothetical protein
MQRVIVILLILGLAATAFANDESARRVLPTKSILPANQGTPDGREGGETIADAFVIPALPFYDTGNTCDNINDYDEACTYTGSTAPDVVYSYSPGVDMRLFIDLCLSGYDTKVYVYDQYMTVYGCNDDYYFGDPPECYYYSSYLEVVLPAGGPYYIVVDGYGTACGDYYLSVEGEPYVPCVITCDAEAMPEGEPPLVVDYVDNYNGGCNAAPNVFQDVYWVDTSGCAHIEGVSGWYPYLGGQYRDTDWYEVVAGGPSMSVKFITDNEETLTRVMMTTANPSCAGYAYSFQTSAIVACDEMTWTVPTTGGATYWIFVAPAEWIDGPLEFKYCLEICGHMYQVIPTQNESWGAVKTLYR